MKKWVIPYSIPFFLLAISCKNSFLDLVFIAYMRLNITYLDIYQRDKIEQVENCICSYWSKR